MKNQPVTKTIDNTKLRSARRKYQRSNKYNGKFFGLTKEALENLRKDIPSEYIRLKATYLLMNMLLYGDWDYYHPEQPFKCSQRLLRETIGWAFDSIRKYRKELERIEAISINYHGGLYGKAHLYKLNTKYMGIRH